MRTNNLVDNYVISLASKPFAILTGSSGTGKTRLAVKVAEKLEEEYEVNQERQIFVDNRGRILNIDEKEIRDICKESNIFIADIDDKEYQVEIQMNTKISSNDEEFERKLQDSTQTEIRLSAATFVSVQKRHLVIPVGADWTDTTNLLGYMNPFGTDGKTTYELTECIKLLLRALHPSNHQLPFFLILDEMNLSYVERYFSIFLSAMEADNHTQKSGISIIDPKYYKFIKEALLSENESGINNSVEIESIDMIIREGKPLKLAKNVFIIGTVNIDETTYVLSPKVLDRAHIIEMNTISPKFYFQEYKEAEISSSSKDAYNRLLKLSITNRENKEDRLIFDESKLDKVEMDRSINLLELVMSKMYEALKEVGFDFGFRAVNEILNYVFYNIIFSQDYNRVTSYLDIAITQKILPKIHGNQRYISPSIEKLVEILSEYKGGGELAFAYTIRKLEVMLKRAQQDGYISYIN